MVEEDDGESKEKKLLVGIFVLGMIFLVIFGALEALTLAYAYINADTVKCNWLWCEFTEVKGTANITISQDCYVNGVATDCESANNLSQLMQTMGMEATK